VLHYCQTERDDSEFWQFCKHMVIPESLKNRMELFKKTGRFVQRKDEIFVDSWLQVMIGQGLIPDQHHPLADEMSTQELQNFLNQVENDALTKAANLPYHADYLNQYCKAQE
jgi:tryptophan halogenase